MRHPANHLFDHTPESLRAWCEQRRWPAFRATQILEWVYAKGVADPQRMTNLPAAARETLAHEMAFLSGDVLSHQSASDATEKLLVQWRDGSGWHGSPEPCVEGPTADTSTNTHISSTARESRTTQSRSAPLPVLDPARQTECVMIPTESRRTACISSQVGCPVGCRFCASGLGGLDANLSAGRIVEQVWRLARLPGVQRLTNVVFMGMGEPLANLAPVIDAVRTIAAPWGMGIGARKITISTVGLPAAIERLAEKLDLPVTLALSLHAPNDELRRRLIPWAEHATIAQLTDACATWFNKTGREITLEYILLGGLNDRPEHADQLAEVAATLRANINLIRYNEVAGLPYRRPATGDVRRFHQRLTDRGANAHIRASRGRDIAAACGQLRHEKSTSTPT